MSETTNTSEKIQTAILERICFLEYRAGERLKEADIAAEFGVSRTPVRDALSRIQHLELIETRNGVGTVVIALPKQKIIDVYEMRLKLASMIGEMSCEQVTDHHRERIAQLLARAQILSTDFHSRNYVVLNHALHQLICDLISNSMLQSFWRQTYYQAASVWYRIADVAGPDVVDALVEELSNLQRALELGDLHAVGFIQRTHIGYGFARIKRHLLGMT